MKFEIKPIKPAMSHEEKVYEYARRISHYSQVASRERSESKKFSCTEVSKNTEICGQKVGCTKRASMVFFSELNDRDTIEAIVWKCESCKESSAHYQNFRDAKSKQGAAIRQLNKEMKK